MYVSKLEIKNYRNFINFSIELLPFTLIIGENNTGKTNLLRALGLVFNNEITFYKNRMLDIDDFNNVSIRNFKESILNETINAKDVTFPDIIIRVVMEGFDEDQEAIVGDWFIDNELNQATLTYLFNNRNPKKVEWINSQREKVAKLKQCPEETEQTFYNRKLNNIDFPIKDYEYTIYGGDNITKQVDNYFLKMLCMEFLDALRDAKNELVAGGKSSLLYKVLINRDESKFSELKEELATLNEKVDKNEELNTIKTSIKDYLDKISLQDNEEDNSVDFDFSNIETAELLKKLSLVYGNSPVNVERNGLGRNNLLYMALVLSHLYSVSGGTNKNYFRIVAIEEPESHLQPILQEHLARNIQNESSLRSQIIITSHSPHIVSKLDLENTTILFKDRDGTLRSHYILGNFGTSANEKKIIHYLKKYLDATKSTLFFSRRVILVEGISEQLLLPILFKAYSGNDLAKLKCMVVNVNGLAFSNFLHVIKNGYFIKCIAITDKDTGTKLENRSENLKKEFTGCPLIGIYETSESTFEKDILKHNLSGTGKQILLSALLQTRPEKGKEYSQTLAEENIDVDAFFALIENYKSEFAYNLLQNLTNDAKGFNIPNYIQCGLQFLLEE